MGLLFYPNLWALFFSSKNITGRKRLGHRDAAAVAEGSTLGQE
jgi:hypothetical protein